MTTYSYSRLGTFDSCPRKYYYQYVAKIKLEERPEGIEAFLGSRVHDALEKLYRDHSNGKTLTKDELVACFHDEWQKQFHDRIAIVKEEYTADDYQRVGVKALEDYYDRHTPFDQSQTLDLEKRVLIDVHGDGRFKLKGFIDRLSQRTDGTFEIHDYKTSGKLPSQAEMDGDKQLALYQLGISDLWDDVVEVDLVWHFLRFDKELRSRRSKDELEALKQDTVTRINTIESRGADESDFETNVTSLCNWCEFQSICLARRHLVETEKLPANQFRGEPGVELVNRHSELADKIREASRQVDASKEEQAQIEKAILDYAGKNGLEVVVGSEQQATIQEKTEVNLPTKGENPDQFDELESKLRESTDWPDVSSPDMHKLKRIAKGDETTSDEIASIVEPFIRRETVRRVGFRKR